MSSETYTDLSFTGIQQTLRNFLSSQDEFKDFDFDGSAISVLLDLLAYNAQSISFQANMQFNEAFLDSAEIRANVASNASILGYVPRSKTSAQCLVSFTVTPANVSTAPSSLTIKHNQLRFVAIKDNVTYIFVPDKDYSTSLSGGVYTYTDVNLLQGEWNSYTYEVEGSAVQSYQLPSTDIDTSTLSVRVQPSITGGTLTTYDMYSDLFNSDTVDDIYFIRENRLGYYEIEFGDGVLYNKVEDGNVILVEFVDTKGVDGNGISSFSPVGSVEGYSNITITHTEKSYNGASQEDIESIRQNAPLRYVSGGNAVINNDYVSIIPQIFSEADDVISWGGEENVPKAYGFDFISVKPTSTEILTDAQKTTLIADLKERNVGSITPFIVDPTYLYINVDLTVKHDPTKTLLNEISLGSKMKDAIASFSSTNLEAFGKNYEESQLAEYINNSDLSVTSNQIAIQLERRFVPTVDVSTNYTVDVGYTIGSGTLDITGFVMVGTEAAYEDYITDNGTVLELRIRSSDSDVFVSNIGVIDSTGQISINNFSPTTIVDDYVKVLCSVSEEDISASQQDIVSLISNSVTITT
ncbi:MAG: hypothetical protein KAS32_23420 [Candidatus Peribacteraceae bacterium]|nr:hypothetical protein [Candidatus Peribacteraceae bacterium]